LEKKLLDAMGKGEGFWKVGQGRKLQRCWHLFLGSPAKG
jgi:hypothetical protein